jgi:hypothetical protein
MDACFFQGLPRKRFPGKFMFFHVPANQRVAASVLFGLPEAKNFTVVFDDEPHCEGEHIGLLVTGGRIAG